MGDTPNRCADEYRTYKTGEDPTEPVDLREGLQDWIPDVFLWIGSTSPENHGRGEQKLYPSDLVLV